MQERTSYPAGVPCWIDTMQPDAEAAVAFYGGLFGWEFEDVMPADAPGRYFIGRLRGKDVAAIGDASDPTSAPAWTTYVAVDSADDAVARVGKAGGQVVMEPTDAMDAGRMAVCSDTAGATFAVWEARRTIGAQLVNEPGTWNFSDLNTRDVDGAIRFYRDVFDWEVETFEMGGSAFSFFKLAGYGDFLAKDNPELRESLDADGAPGGFADAVATMVPMASDQSPDDVPPHWSITFAVDDADAIASRAEQLGGTVLTPPFDIEPVRMTILADPQGTVFTASKYQPDANA
jgi:uncharacterized protein